MYNVCSVTVQSNMSSKSISKNLVQIKLYTTSRQLHPLHGLVIHKHALQQKNNIFQIDHEVLRMPLMITYNTTCLDNLPSPGKLLLNPYINDNL